MWKKFSSKLSAGALLSVPRSWLSKTHFSHEHAGQTLRQALQRMQRDSFFGDDFFSHPFRLFEPLLGGFGNRLLTEFPEPVDVTRQAQQAVAEAPEDALVDKAEQERFSLQRQRNALQTQLRHAVEAEDFESAAKLRDQLKALPQQ